MPAASSQHTTKQSSQIARLYAEMDPHPVHEPSWQSVIARVLLHLYDRAAYSAAEWATMPYLDGLRRTCRAELVGIAKELSGGLSPISDITRSHPVASAYLRADGHRTTPAAELLLMVLLELALADAAGLDLPRRRILSDAVRGMMRAGSTLSVILTGVCTVSDLQFRMARHLRVEPHETHRSFVGLWESWLRDKLSAMQWRSASRLRATMCVPHLGPDLDAPTIPVAPSHVDEAIAPDDAIELSIVTVVARDGPRTDIPRACAASLLRASASDLMVPPSSWVPDTVTRRICTTALDLANRYIRRKAPSQAEPYLALVFACATGVREIDLRDVCWGDNTEAGELAVDPTDPILHRVIHRPPNAYRPDAAVDGWVHPSPDALDWPLPSKLHRALCAWGVAVPGQAVFPELAGMHTPPYSLVKVVRQLEPGLALGAAAFRMALASIIGQSLGSEVAQLVLGDTFSVSTGPAYYCAVKASDVQQLVGERNERCFGASDPMPLSETTIGSRLVIKEGKAKAWPSTLRQSCRRRRGRTELDDWQAHRNHLAAALCAVTGHRPYNAIGRITLDDVIPEYGLVILCDKQVDPLHATRIAATGNRWVGELRGYLDRLAQFADHASSTRAGALARDILLARNPLFDILGVNDDVRPLTAAILRQTMPTPLQEADNYYRHRLNRCLQRRDVDPELRHWQLGWLASPVHAVSNLSPVTPVDLAEQLGPVLDAIMLEDGWFPASRRVPVWTWSGVPERPLVNWDERRARFAEQHKAQATASRAQLRRDGRAMEPAILARLAQVIEQSLPGLQVDLSERQLVASLVARGRRKILMEPDHYGLLLDQMRTNKQEPVSGMELIVTRNLLYALFRRSHREGLTDGALPPRTARHRDMDPSPFLPGLGQAVRCAQHFRAHLLDQIATDNVNDRSVVALLGVLTYSPYRSIKWARAAVSNASRAVRGRCCPDIVRVAVRIDRSTTQFVMNGIAAILVCRRGLEAPTGRAPSETQVERWLERHGSFATHQPSLKDLAATLRAAGLLELSGTERLLMSGDVSIAPVTSKRCIAVDDGWPVCTAVDADAFTERISGRSLARDDGQGVRAIQTDAYRSLLKLLNPDTLLRDGRSRHGWRPKLATALDKLRRQLPRSSTVALLASHALHRLRYGGARKRQLQQKTLHTDVTRFGRRLVYAVGTGSLLEMPESDLLETYLATLSRTPKGGRRLAAEALGTFQRYLEYHHQVPHVSFNEIWTYAGKRVQGTDPGILTNAEVDAVWGVLEQDFRDEVSSEDGSPESRRLATLRMAAFALLEASGVRPASVHGLTLGDVAISDDGLDTIHIHRTGGYGSAKTSASVGFVPLDGEQWRCARPWLKEWLTHEMAVGGGDRRAPLFAPEPGMHRRVPQAAWRGRLNEIIRWATNDNRARLYWLRKRRVTCRHRAVTDAEHPRARDVYAAMRSGGRASLRSALINYIADPAVPYSASLQLGRRAERHELLASTGLPAYRLDTAWQRDKSGGNVGRLGVAYSQLGFVISSAPPERITKPPPLRRTQTLLPCHVDAYARALRAAGAALDAPNRPSEDQVRVLHQAAVELAIRRGVAPWPLDIVRRTSHILRPPRRLPRTAVVRSQLSGRPAANLVRLAEAWVTHGDVTTVLDRRWGIASTNRQMALELQRSLRQMVGDSAQASVSSHGPVHVLYLDPEPRGGSDGAVSAVERAVDWALAIIWLWAQVTGAVDDPPTEGTV